MFKIGLKTFAQILEEDSKKPPMTEIPATIEELQESGMSKAEAEAVWQAWDSICASNRSE